jgi:hypothetical protein
VNVSFARWGQWLPLSLLKALPAEPYVWQSGAVLCTEFRRQGWTLLTFAAYGLRMRILNFILLLSLAVLTACSTGPRLPVDYMGKIKTQAPVPDMAACIGRFVAVTPVPSEGGLVVDAPNAQPPRRYTVTQAKTETVVMIQGNYTSDLAASDSAAVKCAMPVR